MGPSGPSGPTAAAWPSCCCTCAASQHHYSQIHENSLTLTGARRLVQRSGHQMPSAHPHPESTQVCQLRISSVWVLAAGARKKGVSASPVTDEPCTGDRPQDRSWRELQSRYTYTAAAWSMDRHQAIRITQQHDSRRAVRSVWAQPQQPAIRNTW
jgi:hypothetical protein